MAKCKWSVDGICQVYVFRGTYSKVPCDGLKDRSCAGWRNLDVEDIRFRKPLPSWGGRRAGAGAPRGNLNAVKNGLYSRQLNQAYREVGRILRAAKLARLRRPR